MIVKLKKIGKYKLATVKLIRGLSKLSLKESVDIAETPNSIFEIHSLEGSFSDIEQQFSRVGAEVELLSQEDEKIFLISKKKSGNNYNIMLLSSGDSLIQTIKIIRKITNLSLKECEMITNNTPSSFSVKLSEALLSDLEVELVLNEVNYEITELSPAGIENNADDSAPSSTETDYIDSSITLRIKILEVENILVLIKIFRSIFDISLWESKKLFKKNNIFYTKISKKNKNFILNKLTICKSKIEFNVLGFDDYIPDDAVFYKLK